MYWSLVVVHILILTVISLNTFPIEFKEIELGDVHLVDKQRKGRFIAVNQTTFLSNLDPGDFIREKKSSELPKKNAYEEDKGVSGTGVMKNEVRENAKTDDANQVTLNHQKASDWNSMMTLNNSVCVDYPIYLNDRQTFDYSSLIEEDHFIDVGSQRPDLTNREVELLTEDCCLFDPFVETFARDFYCVDDFVVPVENSVC